MAPAVTADVCTRRHRLISMISTRDRTDFRFSQAGAELVVGIPATTITLAGTTITLAGNSPNSHKSSHLSFCGKLETPIELSSSTRAHACPAHNFRVRVQRGAVLREIFRVTESTGSWPLLILLEICCERASYG
eukprot:625540-Rhodomonas_salina.3